MEPGLVGVRDQNCYHYTNGEDNNWEKGIEDLYEKLQNLYYTSL